MRPKGLRVAEMASLQKLVEESEDWKNYWSNERKETRVLSRVSS